MTQVLSGRSPAKQLESQLKEEIQSLPQPGLASIRLDGDPSSAAYMRMQEKSCARVGIHYAPYVLSAETTTEELLNLIDQLNQNQTIHGILLQHPCPAHIDERACFDRILPEKDVDGVNSTSFGRMSLGLPAFCSATPKGIMELLAFYQIPLKGKHAVVVGRSSIVGRPMAMQLLQANCTVTICHSHTQNLPHILSQADIVVAAVGKPAFIQADWVNEKAVLVDAGYHEGGLGDIHPDAFEKCQAYTPVPGGVGPLTLVTIMNHCVEAAQQGALQA